MYFVEGKVGILYCVCMCNLCSKNKASLFATEQQSGIVHVGTLTTTAEKRESISKFCIKPLMAGVQREQIHSCWNWLEKRGAICSNQTWCCYNSLLGSAMTFTIISFFSLSICFSSLPFFFSLFSFLPCLIDKKSSVFWGFFLVLWSHISISVFSLI